MCYVARRASLRGSARCKIRQFSGSCKISVATLGVRIRRRCVAGLSTRRSDRVENEEGRPPADLADGLPCVSSGFMPESGMALSGDEHFHRCRALAAYVDSAGGIVNPAARHVEILHRLCR